MSNSNNKSSKHSDSAIIKAESGTLRLSSESHANEQENISTYMNYPNGYYAYLRLGKTSGAIRYYPSAQTAYTETLNEYKSLLSQNVTGSKSSFFISDSTDNIIYEGTPKQNGKIHFSIYKGEQTTKTVSLKDYNNNSITTNKTFPMKKTKEIQSVSNIAFNYEEGTHSDTIKFNAGIFVENNILTPENVSFLCLTKESAQQLAKAVQEAAILNKEADNDTFENAIRDVSSNMITVTKKLSSGKPTDEKHCSMHDDRLYCASHSKSPDYLFNGSKLWRRVPGILDYHKLEEAILDMYASGQEMILNASPKHQGEVTTYKPAVIVNKATLQSVSTTNTPIINGATTAHTFNDIVQAIISTVMTYAASSEDILYYLKMKGATLESEIKSLTNDVIAINITDCHLTFSTLSCKPKELTIGDHTDKTTLREKVRTITVQLIICAALSDRTRNSIAEVIDLNSIEDYVSSLTNIAA